MYAERASLLDGAVVWRTEPGPGHGPVMPVLPDGCMDLMWAGGRLLVAGPDTHAQPSDGTRSAYHAVRFAPGAGPAFFGVPAHELRDLRVDLGDIWPARNVRPLAERVTEAPDRDAALEAVALRRAAETAPPDPLLRAVVELLNAGATVASTAAAVGLGIRRLHRRSLDAFGYGPKTLGRVLRLQRALALVRDGVPYAEAAFAAGCSDQAHLARETRDLAGLTLGRYAELTSGSRPANSATSAPSGSRTMA
ncbi:helix-turn-helix domain-containing protein [Streptomyces pacificus]|uniref:Helix-turn-helix domain-containing protein n=1 Tax=Streptomyces pacificus TaxID=2705029 RepID=A0A6A0AXA5_9ACTN|nr:helix-turn-helix domain-containing protein [Streptomyces pacificus]GFH37580.1 helix-turn-helix domain-containing protein [Streptomyces pacificus]